MHAMIILASKSPRRQALLRQIGIDFQVDPANIDESFRENESPEDFARRIAQEKARVTAGRHRKGIVIGADTIVVLDGRVFGKPIDARDAEHMLSQLSGRVHLVITGLTVMDAATGRSLTRTAATRVWFKNLTKQEIMSYSSSGEPLDKAGAYGIQERGALLVERIEGCFYNVVGLPLVLLGDLLKDIDDPFLDDGESKTRI